MNLQSFGSILLQQSREEFLLFQNPQEIISAEQLSQVEDCLTRVQAKLDAGFYVAGYLAYEAAAGVNPAIKNILETSVAKDSDIASPLVFFAVYREPLKISAETWFENSNVDSSTLLHWKADVSEKAYAEALTQIKECIAAGDTYQVNYSFRMLSEFQGDPLAYFKALQLAQSANYSAYINMGHQHICSASPELFFELKNGKLSAKPMKGTINRGLHNAQDALRRNWLQSSEKNRAENLMIVDMIRNDLGRVAKTGSVKVDSLFDIESYPTVFQMTSSVSAQTRFQALDIIKQTFPCASITGAPKISTMKIISELEKSPRGIYTGSIGYISPGGDALFNVAIRTVMIDIAKQQACYGVGGGIVWDSTVDDEYRECHIKAEILTRRPPNIQLLESLRMEADGSVFLEQEHVQRLRETAGYFGFPFDERSFDAALDQERKKDAPARKIQLWLDAKGEFSLHAASLVSKLGQDVCLSDEKLSTQSRFIYHKTSQRQFYQRLIEKQKCDDVLIVNDQGNVTESCSANLVVKYQGKLVTPSLDQGLLNGTFRRRLLEENVIEEAVIDLESLEQASAWYLINSVRGWMVLQKSSDGRFRIVKESLVFPG